VEKAPASLEPEVDFHEQPFADEAPPAPVPPPCRAPGRAPAPCSR
jgi:hypothetical protein